MLHSHVQADEIIAHYGEFAFFYAKFSISGFKFTVSCSSFDSVILFVRHTISLERSFSLY